MKAIHLPTTGPPRVLDILDGTTGASAILGGVPVATEHEGIHNIAVWSAGNAAEQGLPTNHHEHALAALGVPWQLRGDVLIVGEDWDAEDNEADPRFVSAPQYVINRVIGHHWEVAGTLHLVVLDPATGLRADALDEVDGIVIVEDEQQPALGWAAPEMDRHLLWVTTNARARGAEADAIRRAGGRVQIASAADTAEQVSHWRAAVAKEER